MEAKFSYAVVGLFVLVLGAALIGGVLWVSSGRYYGKSYVTYRTYMTDSVAGLNLNAPVKYHGVDVGLVRRIALNHGNTEEVELTLAILGGTPVKADTVAILETQGLTGIAYVELTGGSKDSPLRVPHAGEDVPVIPSGPSLLTRFETAIYAALAGLTRATDTFNALLSEDNRRTFSDTLADLRTVSRTLASRSTSIDSGLANAARTMKNAAAFTGDLPRLVQRMERSADALDRMANAVAQAGSTATTTLEGSRTDLQRFTGEGLPEARALIGEMREITATLRRLADELERNPDILLRGRPVIRRGPGE